MEPSEECDLVLTGARVIDPETGLDGVRAVGITGGSITSVGEVAPPAREVWDVSGTVLAPAMSATPSWMQRAAVPAGWPSNSASRDTAMHSADPVRAGAS